MNDRNAKGLQRSGEQANEKIAVFVCGTQKGGTTSLFGYFCEHPNLQSPDRKELHFFDNEGVDWESPNYKRLHSHFADLADSRLRFEITPVYSFWPGSLERIASYNPDAKLIFLFRDPYERAVSHWAMEYGRGAENLDFSQAIREGRTRLHGLSRNADPWRVFSYLERGRYGEQVERALRLFPRENLLFLLSEDLRNDHIATLDKISCFLGIMPFPNCAPKSEHSRYSTCGAVGPRSGDLAHVAEFVEDDLNLFKDLTGIDISRWAVADYINLRTSR